MSDLRDEFLSEEDLDLKNLTEEELHAYWNAWLLQAQATNDQDAHLYSHGVFEREPPWKDERTIGNREGEAAERTRTRSPDELKDA